MPFRFIHIVLFNIISFVCSIVFYNMDALKCIQIDGHLDYTFLAII